MATIKSDWVYRSTFRTADTLIKHIAEIYLLLRLHLRKHNNITTWTFILTIQVNRIFSVFFFIRFISLPFRSSEMFHWEKFKWLEYHLSFLCAVGWQHNSLNQITSQDPIATLYCTLNFFFIESSAITNSSEKKQFALFIVWRS